MRRDAMIIRWLTTATDKDIRGSVKYANTSSEIWKDLKERFGKESALRAYELKQSLSITHQDGSSVSAYYTKLRVCASSSTMHLWKLFLQHRKKAQRIQGKGAVVRVFDGARWGFLHNKDPCSLNQANTHTWISLSPCFGGGTTKANHNDEKDSSGAGYVQDPRMTRRVLQLTTEQQSDPKRTQANYGRRNRSLDSLDGHKRDGYFKLIGYPKWWPRKAKVDKAKPKAAHIETEPSLAGLTEAQYQVLMKHFTGSEGDHVRKANMAGKENMAGKHNKNSDWIVDSGSTEHIVHKLESLENGTRTIREEPVMKPNGDNIPVEAKGYCTLIGGNKINEVLYVPNFNCNLLSVSRLSKELQCVALRSKKLIGTGRCIQGLYRMGMVAQARKAMAIKVDAKVWHSRLGHASDSKLSYIDCLKDLSFDFKNDVCDSCVNAKHTRTPFPKSTIKTNECFELIHCDIWGKYRKPSTSHASFFLTIVDDFSMALWVFLIKHKSEASECLISFHNMVKTQFSKPIKRIRSDNGGEFTSNRMKEFYAREGILLETTCPHTPQQNGVVERKHRHLLEIAQALMFHGSIPKRLWGECIETATYIINHLPSKVIKNQTPYEIVFGKQPDYGHMRTLGCLAYYSSVETGGDKFEFRGRPGVFMGYPQGTKGFKFLISNMVPVWHEDDYVDQTEVENVTADSTPQTEPTQSTTTHAPTDFVDFGGDMQVEDDTAVEQPHNESRAPRSTRVKLPSSRLQDYEVTLPPSVDHAKPVPDRTSSTTYHLSNYVSYNKFSASHKAFLAAITSVNEPKSFEEAMQDENWRDAMQCEIKAHEDNETWTLETLPEGKHAIDSKWVYKIKYKPIGEIERYKPRLVARGFTQIEGVDYHDTCEQCFSPWRFARGGLYENATRLFQQRRNQVCRLRKSLYGLKQAYRTWYQKFTVSLLEIGYAQSNADHSLFTYQDGGKFVAILIYVDDVVITGDHVEMIQRTKDHLNTNFSIKDLGPLKYFLGIEVARTGDGMCLPMEQNLKLDQCHESHKTDASLYRRLIGRLLYLQATRPDIAYAVNILSQFVSDPRVDHMDAVLRVLRYIKSTLGQGIFIPKSGGFNLVAYCDANWLGCPSTRRSRTGYLLLLGGAPVSWKTKKQSVVSRSSAEAEYRAIATTVSKILWMRWLLKDLTVDLQNATPLYCDNQAARHIANNPVFHERTKPVEMDCYFVRERVASQEILPLHVTNKQQIADLFTKPLGAQPLRDLLGKLGVRDLHAPA
ncbi:LOW QUALITY PROTEIN: hypothetical protein OSB04_006296 [Centaurea solstitialis]|uniref:Integrase catalytic domain-containing protein n=1 Tax=Centaurea solstitialis TaxID=347529 RepID=A0AA38TVG7_9ASTR|nr:LOW QUALITY PROTEIN: hypothetical protein OSB04_006296 [Centaurea solstitialis]